MPLTSSDCSNSSHKVCCLTTCSPTFDRAVSDRPVRFTSMAVDGASAARLGRLETPHGLVETPAFMPVGTQATVKGLTPDQLRATGTRMLLANTYHLALAARRRDGRRSGRAPCVHGLGRSDPDRFGRVPGIQPGGSEPDHGPWRDLSISHRRSFIGIDARTRHGHSGSTRGRRGHVPGSLPGAAGQSRPGEPGR